MGRSEQFALGGLRHFPAEMVRRPSVEAQNGQEHDSTGAILYGHPGSEQVSLLPMTLMQGPRRSGAESRFYAGQNPPLLAKTVGARPLTAVPPSGTRRCGRVAGGLVDDGPPVRGVFR